MVGTTDICYYLEAQIGVMEGFNYSLFEKCCDEFNKFIKCVSRIDHTDTLYVKVKKEEKYETMQYQKNLQFRHYPSYYLGKDKVQKWIAYILPENILETIHPRIEDIPDIINTKCEHAGKPQLTMSMSIADFPFIYFMYFRLVIKIEIISVAFVKSLKKTLLVFNFKSAHISKILKPSFWTLNLDLSCIKSSSISLMYKFL
jgi:hypothetical protein